MTKEKKAKRHRYILSSRPYAFEILQILDSKGSLSYSELKTLADIKPEESSKFAYCLQKLVMEGLVSRIRAKRHYAITNPAGKVIIGIGKLVEKEAIDMYGPKKQKRKD